MKKGDILEWNTINGLCRGIVTESEDGQLICKVDDMTTFLLKDLLDSRTIKVISAQSL